MSRLQTKVAGFEYRESERLLTEQFIGGLNDNMTDEILRDVTMQENIKEAASECMLIGACIVEVKREQRSKLNIIKESKGFDTIWQKSQKCEHETLHSVKCKYCQTGHPILKSYF